MTDLGNVPVVSAPPGCWQVRRFMSVASLALLASCTNNGEWSSLLNPAPYNPLTCPAAEAAAQTQDLSLLAFKDYNDAAQELCRLSTGYASARDTIIDGQMAFDVPIVGLGIASITSLAFHGVATATTGMALGAAGFAGVKSYFEPSVKIAAYQTAASSLECAAAAAGALNAAAKFDKVADLDSLKTSLAAAKTTIDTPSNPVVAKDTMDILVAAYTAGQKAADDLEAALQTYGVGVSKMASFAEATIRQATSTIVKGQPTTDEIVAKFKATLPATGTTTPTSPTPGGAGAGPLAPRLTSPAGSPPKPSPTSVAAELAAKLTQQTKTAATDTNGLNTAWTQFTGCTSSTN